jgi:hypothetical protein
MQSWYEDEESGSQITESIKELIDDELKLVEDASHIIIGGFRYLFIFCFNLILIIYF